MITCRGVYWPGGYTGESLIAEDSVSHSTFKNSRNKKQACSLRAKSFAGTICGRMIKISLKDMMRPDYSRLFM